MSDYTYFIDLFSYIPDHIQHKSPNHRETDKRTWDLSINDIKTIPSYYPLGTYKTLESVTLDILVSRLLEYIRTNNIAMHWDAANKTRICCTTSDLIQFEISLWRQNNNLCTNDDSALNIDKSSSAHDIIIEIRRHDGDCVRFHYLKRELFSYVLHQEENINIGYLMKRVSCPALPTYLSLHNKARPLAIDNLKYTLNHELIINGNSFDLVHGLQMLIFLTDSNSINPIFAGYVCDFILIGQDLCGNSNQAVRNLIFDFLVNGRNCIEHHYVLQILANCLQNCSFQNNKTDVGPFPETLLCWNIIIPSLILDMEDTERNPHIANNATRCMALWYDLAGIDADMKYKEEILSKLERVNSFGRQWYISLSIESENLKKVLSS